MKSSNLEDCKMKCSSILEIKEENRRLSFSLKPMKNAMFHGMKISRNGEIQLNMGGSRLDMFIKSRVLYR